MSGLCVENLAKSYGKKPVFSGVGFSLAPGALACLCGPSGGGKTTLLHVLCGLLPPDAGTVSWNGQPLSAPGHLVPPYKRGMALAFQAPALFPHMTVWQNLRYAAPAMADDALRQLCRRLLIEEVLDSSPLAISGGQAKRAELARALAAEPRLLLLDEPTAHLDAQLRDEVMAVILDSAAKLGAAVLYVTHDEAETARLGAPILRMQGGCLTA